MTRGVMVAGGLLLLAGQCEPATQAPQTQDPVDLIRGDEVPGLLVEIDSVTGRELRAENLWSLELHLDRWADKPDGIEVREDDTLAAQAPEDGWTSAQLDAVIAQYADPEEGLAHVHVLVLDGYLASTPNALGRAWDNENIVVFADVLEAACANDPDLGPERAERVCVATELGVLLHEAGHVFGLVNNGVDALTDHEDPEHAHHCDDEDCVMFWAAEHPDAFQIMKGKLDEGYSGPALGEDCLDDLAAVRLD